MELEPLVVGLGDRRYEVNRPWGPHAALYKGRSRPSDVATDSSDRLYVLNRFDRYVDPDGKPTVAIYEPTGQAAGALDLPDVADGHGIAIGPTNEILVVDRDRHVVRIFANDGAQKLTLGRRNEPEQPFSHPTAAAVGPGGEIFVTDGYGNSRVHRFSSKGELIASWGAPGAGPGQFTTPHDLAFTRQGEIVVCDRENNRIQFFDKDGTFLRQIGDLYHPMAVSVDAEGMILVSDQIPRLSMFTPDGKLAGRCRPVLNGGHGMCIDSAGNIYFSEMQVNRATRLRRIR